MSILDKTFIHLTSGGPNAEVSSWAWQMALNTTTGAFFQGLLDFDFLGQSKAKSPTSPPLTAIRSHRQQRYILFESCELYLRGILGTVGIVSFILGGAIAELLIKSPQILVRPMRQSF